MRNKGAILTLAIALTVVCIYQLSFTVVAEKYKKDARVWAAADSTRDADKYIDSLGHDIVYDILIADYTLREVQEREINFGLDLKGGMNVILEISSVDILRSLANNSTDTTFTRAIARAKQLQTEKNRDFITLFGEAYEELYPGATLQSIFTSEELREKIVYGPVDKGGSTNREIIQIVKNEAEGAINNAFNIIATRIDQFGVSQPNIQRLETNDRILVDLPGVKNKERVKKLLQGTANLEFWETFDNTELINQLFAADEVIREYLESDNKSKGDTAITVETPEEVALDEPAQDSDSDETPSLLQQIEEDASLSDSAIQPLDSRVGLLGVDDMLRPMYSNQTGPFQGPAVGTAHFRDTTKINRYLALARERNIFNSDVRFIWSALPESDPDTKKPTDRYTLYAIQVRSRDGKPPLGGDVIVSASQQFDEASGNAYVLMNMNSEGTRIWSQLTQINEGKSIAVVMDNRVYSAPRVNEQITGGSSQITGNFSITEAQDLANLLKSGKLPAPAHIIQENIVGPSLGKRAVTDGLSSFFIAFIVVLLYMLMYYSRRAGLVADIALVANMFFIAGVLASLGASLTLPGIAGIVLTIGMSVDANVLIFERIREELQAGKGVRLALSDGYKNAYSAIIDANVTTLLTGIILYIFGTGPIKGFATTLVIGILTSLFSAIFITRLIFERSLNKNKTLTFDTSVSKNFLQNINFNFIDSRKIGYVISSIIIIAGIGGLIFRGLDPGVDFTGGRNYIIDFKKPVATEEVARALEGQFGEIPKVIEFGSSSQVRITTRFMVNEEGTEVDEEIQNLIYTGLKPLLDESVDYEAFFEDYWQSNQKVGPSIADDIKRQAVLAIFIALAFMFLYIFLRFHRWQYGLGAIVALVHDALLVLGTFSLLWGLMPFSLEIDQAFIAAILTVVGYSINDTVIIFDRIREYIGLYPKRDRKEIMNLALNSTLSRTFSTSFSTFVVLLAIFVFGGEVIRGFVFALLIGIVVGTYSSLFVATPVAYDTMKRSDEAKAAKKK
jgi:SecD/SecF fusion protein